MAETGYESYPWDGSEEPDATDYKMVCPKGHGLQDIVDSKSFIGFAGGTSFIYTLSCGHFVLDETDDVRAAY